jgi:hypothetical protein
MWGFKMKSAIIAMSLVASCISGCANQSASNTPKAINEVRILSIGHESVITFEDTSAPGPGGTKEASTPTPTDIYIPVTALVPSTVANANLSVQVSGSRPIALDQYALVDTRFDSAARSKARYLDITPRAADERLRQYEATIPRAPGPAPEEHKMRAPAAGIAGLAGVAVRISGEYLRGMREGDRICVQLEYDGNLFESPPKETKDLVAPNDAKNLVIPIRTFRGAASRTFTFYSSGKFHDDKTKFNVPIYSIAAFPVPDSEVNKLFGRNVALDFYVIRLSVRNSDQQDWLLTTGMIRASGRAMVEPTDGTPRFSMPVAVSPQAREHVYAVMERQEVTEVRSVAFRAMTFAGALATALANGFSWGDDAIRGIGIYTGVGVPEGQKLWPDLYPAYKRNLVNYAMAAHVKVPRTSTSTASFIFFSKRDVETLVLDSNLFGKATEGRLEWLSPSPFDKRGEETPNSYVISLAVDSLDIPYEIVVLPDQPVNEPLINLANAKQAAITAASDHFNRASTQAKAALVVLNDITDSGMASIADAKLAALTKQVQTAADAFVLARDSSSKEQAEANAALGAAAAKAATDQGSMIAALRDLSGARAALAKSVIKPDDSSGADTKNALAKAIDDAVAAIASATGTEAESKAIQAAKKAAKDATTFAKEHAI